jgi:hypothetical protein
MGKDNGLTDYAQFWWAQNALAERRLCEVDKYDGSLAIYRPDVYETISTTISSLDGELRLLSLDIHSTLYLLVYRRTTGFLVTNAFDIRTP